MRITNTYDWHRRDFRYDAECEFCGHKTRKNSGYDDSNYYNNVLPDMKCSECGKSTKEHGDHEKVTPRHNPNITM